MNDNNAKAVVTYIRLGEKAYGVNPGIAKIGFTVRASDDRTIQEIVEWTRDKIERGMNTFDGEIAFEVVEPFAATINSKEGYRIVERAVDQSGMEMEKLNKPFPWSEDFGAFRDKFPVTLFGMGAGKDHPPLHSERYDFNDRLIEKGVQIYSSILRVFDELV